MPPISIVRYPSYTIAGQLAKLFFDIAYVVGSFAEVAESWDWEKRRKRALDLVFCGFEEGHLFGM